MPFKQLHPKIPPDGHSDKMALPRHAPDDDDDGSQDEQEEDAAEDAMTRKDRTSAFAPAGTKRRTSMGLRRKVVRAPSLASSSMCNYSVRSSSGFRLKRAFLVGRRGGSSTPVPGWKILDADGRAADAPEHHTPSHHTTISARKLAATLWELQEVPFSRGGLNRNRDTEHEHYHHQQQQQDMEKFHHNADPSDRQMILHAQSLSPASSRISHGSPRNIHNKFVESLKKQQPGLREQATGTRSAHVLKLLERRRGRNQAQATNVFKENDTEWDRNATPKTFARNTKMVLKGLGSGPTTTGELMKVLNHVRNLEEQHSSSMSLIASLRAELGQARAHMQALMLNEKANRKEVENTMRRILEEKALWREQQEESIRLAVQSGRQELEDERKAKQKLELIHKRVARDLHDAKKSLGKALQELEKERKARELMEDVCDELAKEIGEDKARVEELKRESVKVREEVEEERKMLQMAEIWREERVQMKLMEAKLELEEKNAALDKLRNELEAFLKAKRASDQKDEENHSVADAWQDVHRDTVDAVVGRNLGDSFYAKEPRVPGHTSIEQGNLGRQNSSNVQDLDEDCSDYEDEGDDLHSIELNNEALVNPQWEHPFFQQQEVKIKGRRSTDQRFSAMGMSKPWKLEKSHGLERTKSGQVEARGRPDSGERQMLWDNSLDSQWIDRSIEGGEIREWNQSQQVPRDGRPETKILRQLDTEELCMQQLQAESLTVDPLHEDVSKHGSTESNAAWQHRAFGSSEMHFNSIFSQLSNAASSPTRRWSHYWSSPDPGSPRPGRNSNASGEIPKGLRDTSLKAKLLEAKLEGQQARLRGKGL